MTGVLFDCRPVRPPISGVARYCLGLSEALARTTGYEMAAFVQEEGGTNAFVDLISPEVRKVPARLLADRRLAQNLLLEFLPPAAGLMFERGYDILHETYFANLGHARHAAKIATIHDVIPLDRPELFSRRNAVFARRNFHRQVREADHIISVSAYTKQRILDFHPEAAGRITVIGNGVDRRIVDGPAVAPLAAGDLLAERPFVSFVGNVEPRKNLLTMAQGFDLAFPAGSDWRLVIAGRRNFDADRILREIGEILGERFLYLGPVEEARKWQVLAHAQATVMSSEYEGFGIPIFESYAVETPVMIADNSSMSELAVAPEQLFGTFSPERLAEGLREIAEGARWVAPAVATGKRLVAQYTWDAIARDTAAVYAALR
ncbi:glycosyltransferase family 4 protein [Celeribacter indicus]|uniref:Glycosyl transferase group 1 n=1 Tax=Celeribacter indicus TaxID=1208324 RepID=A0A0B5DPB3_9RHOB|nr:glycosyltransferase family 1 protein [Celeribacter indicus]AJE45423.1 glycosyl transferase group 1 [Celeribacter indicus]SDX01621.1 Glycosyltransferase involved in cell wall bisynthesis [Celeribacter indicus]